MNYHVRKECKHGHVRSQCRCPGINKRIDIVECDPSFCIETRDREHDSQPDPIPNDHPHSVDIAIEFLRERKEFGIAKYGTALQPHNGRDSLSDAIDEAADLLVYLINARAERDSA